MSIPDRIIIREIDATTVQQDALPMDIAYVPGFMGTDKNGGMAGGTEESGLPILCTTLDEFKQYFGVLPRRFGGNDYDIGYIYAAELIAQGMPVYYQAIDILIKKEKEVSLEEITREDIASKLAGETDEGFSYDNSVFKLLEDRGEYSIKYLTTGGIVAFDQTATTATIEGNPIAKNMIQCATKRADCIALITPKDADEKSIDILDKIQTAFKYEKLQGTFGAIFTSSDYPDGEAERKCIYAGSNATVMYPWFDSRLVAMGYTLPLYTAQGGKEVKEVNKFVSEVSMPADFAYMFELARSIRTNPSWLAIAGVTRGRVSTIEDSMNTYPLHTADRLSNTIADQMQPKDKIAVNAITNIRPYGYTIWGNRTLFDNAYTGGLVASSFLNIRNLVCDIKKTLYVACKSLMFEQNTSILWVNFKSQITPLLDQMVSGGGIEGYKIKRLPTNERGKVVASVTIYPIYAVENFDITVIITDSDVTVSE